MTTDKAASQQDHAYFREVETAFIRLRGAPLLLSPSDWQVAKEWRRKGVPIELAVRVMERIFDRQGSEKRSGIRSLRYFRTAVEGAWRRILELGAGEVKVVEADPIDIPASLRSLAAALPSPQSPSTLGKASGSEAGSMDQALATAIDGIADKIVGLTGSVRTVERELQQLDHEFMRRLCEGLSPDTLARLEAAVRDGMTELSERMADDTVGQTLELLLRRRLRKDLSLPMLSLFSPESRASS